MRHFLTIATVTLIFGVGVAINEHVRKTETDPPEPVFVQDAVIDPPMRIRAAGVVVGREESAELRPQIRGLIRAIRFREGQTVQEGQVLVELDDDHFKRERDLAEAKLRIAIAEKEKLISGARPSEIESAKQDFQASLAKAEGAHKDYSRGVRLAESKAISQSALEELNSNWLSLSAQAQAAKKRLETIMLPPRIEDVKAAQAAVEAAQSELGIAEVNLGRTKLVAPTDGTILAINRVVGELAGPADQEPLLVLSDTSLYRALVEIDEFDALRVQLGKRAELMCDGLEGVVATGVISEIQPQMSPKKIFRNRAGERIDTMVRQIWVDLQSDRALPIGLPVDVFLDAADSEFGVVRTNVEG